MIHFESKGCRVLATWWDHSKLKRVTILVSLADDDKHAERLSLYLNTLGYGWEY